MDKNHIIRTFQGCDQITVYNVGMLCVFDNKDFNLLQFVKTQDVATKKKWESQFCQQLYDGVYTVIEIVTKQYLYLCLKNSPPESWAGVEQRPWIRPWKLFLLVSSADLEV